MQIDRFAAFTLDGAGGNPAGVVLADALPPPVRMQRIAAEVGYSETVFAAPGAGGAWQVRYFSPESEVPFCGHATIALGVRLAEGGGARRFALSLAQGAIAVEGSPGRATLTSPPTRSAPAEPALLAEALALFGLAPDDLDPGFAPARMNAGAEHLCLALRDRARLAAMDYDLDAGRDLMGRHGLVTVALVWREAPRLFHARNAFASGGVREDPATGAAAAALGGMLRDGGRLAPGGLVILQGADMGRPSRIDVELGAGQGSPVRVSGAAARIG